MAKVYKKPDTIPLSYSAITEFENCPYKFYANKVLKKYPFKPTAQTEYGNRLHKAFEVFIKDGTPLTSEAMKHAPLLEALKNANGEKLVEHHMAVNWKNEPVDYMRGRNIWIRGQFDLMIRKSKEEAVIFDYKTGSDRYPKLDQLECMAMLTFLHFPDIQHIKGGLLFIEHDSRFKQEYDRDKLPTYIERWQARSIPIIQSLKTDKWDCKPNPLCNYCPVMECSYRGEPNEEA